MKDFNEYKQYQFEPVEPVGDQTANQAGSPYGTPYCNQYNNQYGQPMPPMPPKKNHTALKIVAVALSCIILGGASGGILTAYFFNRATTDTSEQPAVSNESTEAEEEKTPLLQSVTADTTPVVGQTGEMLTPQQVYANNVDSVVGIATSGTMANIFGQTSNFASSGSGFVVSEDGYIVTNHHVIEGADTATVTFQDGSTYDAEIIGSEASNDVALLKIDATELHAVSLADSDNIKVGDQVAAIGNPLGELTFTQTVGYISALDRAINTDGTPINMMQTDVAINSGNSGGPLFDMHGNVIGVTTAKYSGNTTSGASIEGIGFALPINDVIRVVNDLKDFGYVTGKAFLGITLKELDPTVATYYGMPQGVYVDTVTSGSCAETAGLQQGDVITAIGENETPTYSDLSVQLGNRRAGDVTTITIYRSGETLTLDITLDEKQPAPEAQ